MGSPALRSSRLSGARASSVQAPGAAGAEAEAGGLERLFTSQGRHRPRHPPDPKGARSEDRLRAKPAIALQWAQSPGPQPRGLGSPRPVRPAPRLPARPTYLVSGPRARGAAAQPEAEAEAERGAQQHGGGQQRGHRLHRVPAQQQPRVAPAVRPAAGHRGRSGRGPAASRRPAGTAPARRPVHRHRQVGDAGLGARGPEPGRARGSARSPASPACVVSLPGLLSRVPALPEPEGGAWIFRPKL